MVLLSERWKNRASQGRDHTKRPSSLTAFCRDKSHSNSCGATRLGAMRPLCAYCHMPALDNGAPTPARLLFVRSARPQEPIRPGSPCRDPTARGSLQRRVPKVLALPQRFYCLSVYARSTGLSSPFFENFCHNILFWLPVYRHIFYNYARICRSVKAGIRAGARAL